MNIKSLLIGSAAALAAVSGAQAADAIVAAEPEPMEYVRVCDAFGTGFFYIPGTETCLKIGGEVRFQVGVDRGDRALLDFGVNDASDWNSATRARLEFDARNDTEYGTLQSFIRLEATSDIENVSGRVGLHSAFIDIAGESDVLSNIARFNSIRYTYDGGAFSAGVSVDELDIVGWANHHDVGVTGMVSGSLGPATFQLLGGQDTGNEDGAVRAILNAEVGPGTFGLAGVWASDPNAYYNTAEWTIAASYAAKVSDKLTVTPAVSYFSNVRNPATDTLTTFDGWGASLLAEYSVTTGLKASAAVVYTDVDAPGVDSEWSGFVRVTGSF